MSTVRATAFRPDRISVLCLHDDPEYRSAVTGTLAEATDVDVLPETDPRAAVERLPDVDCIVSDFDLQGTDALDVLGAVRERDASLPFLLHTARPLDEAAERLLADDGTDYLARDDEAPRNELLARRVRLLVERDRFGDAMDRLAVAVDTGSDPTLVVSPDGTIEYANGHLASALSPARTDLRGRPWTDLFPDATAEQLQHEAVTVGSEGWNWSGRTPLSVDDGVEMTARTHLVQLEDGSKVFIFRDLDRPETVEA